jgi:hypothetical protein
MSSAASTYNEDDRKSGCSGVSAEPGLFHPLLPRELRRHWRVQLTEGTARTPSYSPDQRYIIDSYQRDIPPVNELRRRGGSLVCKLESDIANSRKTAGKRPGLVSKGRDGQTDIWGSFVARIVRSAKSP